MAKCFYLVYKITRSPLLWIVNITNNLMELYSTLKNFDSIHEKYYIIMKEVEDIDSQLIFKRFTIFKKDLTCKIIYESK